MELLPQRSALPCVLYVDDEPANRQVFHAAFRRDMHVLVAATAEEALRLLAAQDVHVIIADQRMPGMSGSELLAQVRRHHPQVRRMLLTAFADLDAVVNALNEGGTCYYIRKPWEHAEVTSAVRTAYRDLLAEREQASYTAQLLKSNQQLEFALRQRLLS